VLGRSFPLRLLELLEGSSTPQLVTELQELVTRQFLTCDEQASTARYAFQNALLQDAVYQTLLLTDRQRLHWLAAHIVERDDQWSHDERTQLLAYHYAECATPQHALPYLIRAAEHSARRYANETAMQHYRRALALVAEHDSHALATIRIGLARALKFAGQYAEATQILHQAVAALRLAPDAGQELLLVEALCELAEVYQRDGALDLAVAALDEGLGLLDTAEQPGQQRLRSRLLDRLASVRFRQGDLDAAYGLAVDATRTADIDAVDDPVTLASLFNTLGGVLWQRGALDQASWNVEQSLRLYRYVGYSWGMATAYTNLGILSYARGVWPEAVSHFQRSDALRKEIGYIPERAVNLKNLGVLQMEMGDHVQARQSLETSLAISRRIGDDYGVLVVTLQLADLVLLQQRVAEARIHLGNAATLLPAAGEDEEILFRWLSGLADAAEGRVERGMASIREALEKAVAAGVPELEIDCERVLGALLSRSGALREADPHLQRSLALSIEHSSTYRHGLALYELGWHHYRASSQSNPPDQALCTSAHHIWQQACERFRALGAKHELSRVQAALTVCEE
jgi:tetratricopeptide (TPR) repeat protein